MQHLGTEVIRRCKDAHTGTMRDLMKIIYGGPSPTDSLAKPGWIYMYR